MKKYLAEMVGTFALVFCGTGAIIIDQDTGGVITGSGVALVFGLVVSAMIYCFGSVSGAHLNPAVTFAFAISKRFSPKEVAPYIFSQMSGAILASILLRYLFPSSETLGATLPSGTVLESLFVEIVLAFLLMLVILLVSSGSREKGIVAGVAIGSVVFLEAYFAGPVSGASMNPARSFAPAIVSGHLEHLWLYLAAPITGALSAIPVWRIIKHRR